MANATEERLRRLVSRFINGSRRSPSYQHEPQQRKMPFADELVDAGARQVCQRFILRKMMRANWRAVLFGGTLRDLMVHGLKNRPRDIDVVVDDVSIDELISVFGTWFKRRTRFGGLHLDVHGCLFDIWPLRDTWAFREQLVHTKSIAELPKTTFLNVEAVVVELGFRPGRPRMVYSNGFFEAIRSRVIDVNLEENPYPALCVVRSLITAAGLRFRIAPRLAAYLVEHGSRSSVDQLLDVQRKHYGYIRCGAPELSNWLDSIQRQLRASPSNPVELLVPMQKQLELCLDSRAAR